MVMIDRRSAAWGMPARGVCVAPEENQLEEVGEPAFLRGKPATVAVKLSPEDVRTLKRIAKSEGVSEVTLLGRWVHERLRKSS